MIVIVLLRIFNGLVLKYTRQNRCLGSLGEIPPAAAAA